MELKGTTAARALVEGLTPDIDKLRQKGVTPCLAVLRMGSREDDLSYERGITKRFEGTGCAVKSFAVPADCTQSRMEEMLFALNHDKGIHGILVFRPLPAHIDMPALEWLMDTDKDVDCMSPLSAGRIFRGDREAFAPCTAQSVMELLSYYEIPVAGKRAVIVGRSHVVGRPLSMLMLAANATPTVCHTRTSGLAAVCREADILVACAGKAGMISADMLKPGAVLIDVGINVVNGRLCGDASPEACAAAASYSPVPGGVGSLTSAVLLKHTVTAAKQLTVNQ